MKCEKRAGAGERHLIFALLVLYVRTILSESLAQSRNLTTNVPKVLDLKSSSK